MSNPFYMYDIFASLNKIEASIKSSAETLKESAVAATATPKSRIDEKYQGWDKTVAAIKKGGSAKDPEAVAASIGRKKYGKEKFQKAAAAGKKLGEQSYKGDRPGQTNFKPPSPYTPSSTPDQERAAMYKKNNIPPEMQANNSPAYQNWRRDRDEAIRKGEIVPSAKTNEDAMCNECGMYESRCNCNEGMTRATLDDILRKHRPAVKAFKQGHDFTDELYNDLYDYFHHEMPYGVAKARTGDPYEWIADRLSAELDEGNAFSGAVARAKANGIQPGEKIHVGGKEYPVKEAGTPMTPKQKSFAKLAPPQDKITFADRIAGAKQEVDEVLGDVAATAMKSAVGKMKKPNSGFPTVADAARRLRDKEGRTTKGTVTKTATGLRHTRDYEHDVEADDEKSTSGEKRKAGRPKKYSDDAPRQERITARSRKQDRTAHGQSGFKAAKNKVKEDDVNIVDRGEYDQEGDMAKNDIKTIVRHAQALQKILGDNDNLPEWVQSKLAKIEGMMTSVDDYMQNQAGEEGDEQELGEKAVSQKQQKFMGMVHAMQKGEKVKGASPELKKTARTMKKKDADDFASTKRKGLPKQVKGGKPVDEDGGPGGVDAEKPYRDPKSGKMVTPPKGATQPPADTKFPPGDKRNAKRADASTGGDEKVAETDKNPTDSASKKAKSGGGMTFGKGIYDSMSRNLESMISESMSINTSMSSDGTKSITITATEEDADKLADILKMAGLESHGGHSDHDDACPSCGSSECECDMVEEVSNNQPDYPENMGAEQDDIYMLKTLSGGLNRPKVDQTVMPHTLVKNQKDDMLENTELGLWNLYKRMS